MFEFNESFLIHKFWIKYTGMTFFIMFAKSI